MQNPIISWIIILEVALPFMVLSAILAWSLIRNKQKNKEAVRGLIIQIKNNEEKQKEALLTFLTQKLGLEEDKAKKHSKKIINERKFLFRNLISVLLDKNLSALIDLEDDLSRITKQYHELEVIQKATVPEVVEAEPEEVVDVEALRKEIKTLKHEVHITLTTLNNIFSEFSSMFGEEVPDRQMSVDQIITAMESFSGKVAAESKVEETMDSAMSLEDEDDEPDAFSQIEDDELDNDSFSSGTMHVEDEEGGAENSDDEEEEETLDFSIDSELDDIDSALDELELGVSSDDEPSWDDAFAESGDKKNG